MAHADYDCCANCDTKMNYSNDPTTKDKICADCAIELFKLTNVKITDGETFTNWITQMSAENVKKVLTASHYHACFYPNSVDKAVLDKGLDIVGSTFYHVTNERTDLSNDRMVKP